MDHPARGVVPRRPAARVPAHVGLQPFVAEGVADEDAPVPLGVRRESLPIHPQHAGGGDGLVAAAFQQLAQALLALEERFRLHVVCRDGDAR
ncbi:hypothetical protein ACFFX0_03610 [Citricoccus parietis]|uniref:Uncharacterized protein n=1 Tax=Citricoccus parietis TaxID=592307 RepID=A0ABV5FUG0_9MICC